MNPSRLVQPLFAVALTSLFALAAFSCANPSTTLPAARRATSTTAFSSPTVVTPTIASVVMPATPSLCPSTPLPSPERVSVSDLAQYFDPFVGWGRHIPEWMREPPGDRQVTHISEGAVKYDEVSLLDRDGTLLANFTEADGGGYIPDEILWSWNKECAVVEFHAAGGSVESFLIIDRNGKRLSSLLGAYWGPMWSPTRNLLAYHSTADSRLYIVDENGSPVVVSDPFTPRACIACSVAPQWAPDGSEVALIVYIATPGGATQDIPLCLMNLDKTVTCTSLLAYNEEGLDMHWLDNRYLLLRTRVSLGYRYFVFDTTTNGIREVTNSTDLTPVPSKP
jgi:hypothetical protein